jgi:hypothetical protein
MINALYLVGAYGRQYDNQDLMIADWKAGKDFRLQGGQYMSIREMQYTNDFDTVYLNWVSKDRKQFSLINVREI